MLSIKRLKKDVELLERFAEKNAERFYRVNNLNYCVRPSRELYDKEHELNLHLGYGHRLVARSTLHFATTEEKTGFFYGTAHFLEHRSHRFIVGTEDRIDYHRQPFNVDYQKIPSTVLNLSGIDAIHDNRYAAAELHWLAGAVHSMRPNEIVTSRIAVIRC